jgi:hypothetical protein
VLDAGIDTRAGVAFGFAASTELTIKVTPHGRERPVVPVT